MASRLIEEALRNFGELQKTRYPGRIVIVGMSENSQFLIQITAIEGRGANSQNRQYVEDGWGRVSTAPFDPTKVTDPSLIIYTAMDERGLAYVASNGCQTDAVVRHLTPRLADPLADFTYEPDGPNWTPRITAVSWLGRKMRSELTVLRRSRWGEGCDRLSYTFDSFAPGVGHCISTYTGDGNPLPSYYGEPFLLPLLGADKETVAHSIWNALDQEYRVGLALKWINMETGVSEVFLINRFLKDEKVAT